MVVRLTVQLYTFTRCLYVQTDPPRVVLKTIVKKAVSR